MKKRKNKLLLIIGFSLISFSIAMIIAKFYADYKVSCSERQNVDTFFEEKVDAPSNESNTLKDNYKENIGRFDYIGVLEIPKINLKRGLVDKNNLYNNVNKNIEIIKEADMPDVINGNFILAAHSGTSAIAYFNKLSLLEKSDLIYVYYNDVKHTYIVDKLYEINKKGSMSIQRTGNNSTITLITCKTNEKKQIVVIGELLERSESND